MKLCRLINTMDSMGGITDKKGKIFPENLGLFLLIGMFIVSVLDFPPVYFRTDDMDFLNRILEDNSLLCNSFNPIPLSGTYYRPVSILLWGICHKLFGFWDVGHSLFEGLFVIGFIICFYKTISRLTHPVLAFLAALFFISHTSSILATSHIWFGTISGLFFLWFTVYLLVTSGFSGSKAYLPLIVFSAILAVLSKENAFIPLILLFIYFSLFVKPINIGRSSIYLILSAGLVVFMLFGPSGVFRTFGTRDIYSYSLSYVGRNLIIHLSDIFYTGIPILIIPLLLVLITYVRSRNKL